QALKSALRQDPDVILVGEMRDLETIETALTAAETGHLVMSTLHTLDATETINRIISAFPPYQQKQVRLQLASVLRGVVSQRLIPRADGKGRVAAVEILKTTARVRELIEDKDRTKEISDAISQGHQTYGMQTFDQSLMGLVKNNLVTYEEAHRQATNPDDFALRFSGISATSDSKWDDFESKPAGAPAGARPAAPGAQQPAANRPVTSPGMAAVPRPGAPAAAAPRPGGAPGVAAPRPAAAPAKPAGGKGGDDDFQIERF
ncbi:MAG TPA: ATPase, T2SS/T4P/T4SS family, partial [Longimicrobium sp.]|nr:ATPase, T2SS/T4P/T4SS family [Longimicrobium sp.]